MVGAVAETVSAVQWAVSSFEEASDDVGDSLHEERAGCRTASLMLSVSDQEASSGEKLVEH